MSKIIIGGGISGLSAAYYMAQKVAPASITLIEASDRVGGWIRSVKQPDGIIFEQGPRTIRPRGANGSNTLQLIEELGLENEIRAVPSNHPAALNRMIYAKGQLHSLPSSFLSIFKKQPPFSKPLVSYLLNDLKGSKDTVQSDDDSIYNFVERRFGTEVADYLISPLICGVCAGNAKAISVKFLMENMFINEQRYGSITKGILFNLFKKKKNIIISNKLSARAKKESWNIYSFKNGLESLPLALEDSLLEKGVTIKKNTTCSLIKCSTNNIEIYTNNGSKIEADHLVAAVPAKCLSNMLDGHEHFCNLLKSIPTVNVCVINLLYNSKLLNKEAFGFLVPPKENLPILGVIYDSCCFSIPNKTLLTVMMGGHWFTKHFGNDASEQNLLEVALKQLKTILNIQEAPASFKVNILFDCIPQYIVGHNETVNEIKQYIKGNNLALSLCGASYDGVGINDVIMSSKSVVNNLHI